MLNRLFGRKPPAPAPPTPKVDYAALFNDVMTGLAAGWSPDQVKACLAGRENDQQFIEWLYGYGKRKPIEPSVAERLVRWGEMDCGVVGKMAQDMGEQVLNGPVGVAETSTQQAVSSEQEQQAGAIFNKGNNAYRQGDFLGAIASYDAALSIKPDNHEALNNKGISLANLKATEAITLEACLLTLARSNGNVETELAGQIQGIGHKLEQGDSQAIEELYSLLQSDIDLANLYGQFRTSLQVQYGERERAKSSLVLNSGPINLLDIALTILQGPNFRSNAQNLVTNRQWQQKVKQASSDLQTFAKALEKTVTNLDPAKVTILRKLDQEIFSVDDLAYLLEISVERTQDFVQALWNEGYLRPISDNPFVQLWQGFKGAPPLTEPPSTTEELALTTKGYFYLHPGKLFQNRTAKK